MMTPGQVYFLEANLGIVLFYAFYRLLCVRDTFFVGRRVALLSFVAASFVLPFVGMEWSSFSMTESPVTEYVTTFLMPEVTVATRGPSAPHPLSAGFLLAMLYYAGVAVMAVRMGARWVSVLRLLRVSPSGVMRGRRVRLLPDPSGPFSFFGWIFVHRESVKPDEEAEVLAHETAHVRQWHSVDVVLMELLTVVCWWNPFAWLMKRETRENLEYLADRSVIRSGFNPRGYQYHLVALACQNGKAGLINSFNLSNLKKRIIMMNKKRTNRTGYLKYALFAFPAFALLMLGNMSCTSEKKQADESVKEQPVSVPDSVDQPVAVPLVEDTIYNVVEEMPQFPGGVSKLMEFITKNLQYPESAQEQGIQGRVIAQYVVEKDGSVSNIRVIRGVSEELDAEAVRVLKLMPKWTPGKQNGKPVRCRYTIPVQFRIR